MIPRDLGGHVRLDRDREHDHIELLVQFCQRLHEAASSRLVQPCCGFVRAQEGRALDQVPARVDASSRFAVNSWHNATVVLSV